MSKFAKRLGASVVLAAIATLTFVGAGAIHHDGSPTHVSAPPGVKFKF